MLVKPNPQAAQFAPLLYLGLDLGKERDHTVLALCERKWQLGAWSAAHHANARRPVLALRDLVRVPLNTPYTEVPRLVRHMFTKYEAATPYQVPLKTTRHLVVDAGGVGGGVLDIIRQEQKTGYLGPMQLVPVFTSAGQEPGRTASGCHTVPKRDLLTAIRAVVEAKSLLIPAKLALVEELFHELAGLKTNGQSATKHDDLAMALSLATWWATQQHKELLVAPTDAFAGETKIA